MKKLLFAIPVLVIILLASCTKDQVMVNKIEGTWNVDLALRTQKTLRDTVTPYQQKYTFQKCKLKKEERCSGNITDTTGVRNLKYAVENDSYKLNMEIYSTDTTNRILDIIAIDKNNLELTWVINDSLRIDYYLSK